MVVKVDEKGSKGVEGGSQGGLGVALSQHQVQPSPQTKNELTKRDLGIHQLCDQVKNNVAISFDKKRE